MATGCKFQSLTDSTEELENLKTFDTLKNEQQESDFVENKSAKTNTEEEKSLDCTKGTNQKNQEDFQIDAFKVPSSVQKGIQLSESASGEKKEKVPELKYKEPWWSATPPAEENCSLEVLKNGCIILTLDLNDKAYHVFGRLPLCDIVLEHPSISRYHALIQYRGETDGDRTLSGFYLYDLGSTHGTVVNKNKIKAKTYYRLKVGYVIKFGGSSRLFILQGPRDDDDVEENETQPMEMTTTENEVKVKVGQIFTDEEYNSLKKVEKKSEEIEGIDWGFGEDAEEEQIDSEKFQELYSGVEFKDPKKTLRGYYEREGLELEYQVDETGPGHARVYHCRVRLPIDGPNGSAVYAEASVTGRKKDAVRECANEACKMLDAYGLLRQSSHESRKKRERNLEEDDFYESDEDNFLDRTGTIEKKRLKRMRKAGKEKTEVETHDSLREKLQTVQKEIEVLVKRIYDAEALEKADNGDSLDDFISTMSQRMDKQTKLKLKRKIVELRKDEEKIAKLVALTKPADLSSLQSTATETVFPSKADSGLEGKTQTPEIEDSSMPKVDEGNEKCEEPNVTSIHNEATTDARITPVEKTKSKSGTAFSEFAVPGSTVRPVKSSKTSKPAHKDDETRTRSKGVGELLTKTTDKAEMPGVQTFKQSRHKEEKERNSSEVVSKTVKKEKRYTAPTRWEDANDPDFASWIPPEDQSGDGKTKLNEKYGY